MKFLKKFVINIDYLARIWYNICIYVSDFDIAIYRKFGDVIMSKGKIIVIDGLDGSGKSTQLELVAEYLQSRDVKCRAVSFPNYDSLSGALIKDYLNGKIPCEDVNGAYTASTLYAIDRYVSFVTDWKEFYNHGGIILCGRYTTSNAIYQLTKLPPDEQEKFLDWLFDYEYNKLGLPAPDLVLYLDMPIEVSQRLLSERYMGDEQKKDIHERNVRFLEACRSNALILAQRCGWNVIECAEDGLPLPIEDIYIQICSILKVLFL